MRAYQKDSIAEGAAKLLSADFGSLARPGSELPVLFTSSRVGENLASDSVIPDALFDEVR